MQIAIYAIAKNEAGFVDRWRESAREADIALMADTGSTDGTQDRADAHIAVLPWRFDDARNAAMAILPSTVDVCIALDLDETLDPGWRAALESAWEPGTNNAWVNFNFNGEWFMQNNRVHSRQGWRWKHPCHEALVRSIGTDVHAVNIPEFRITHRPDLTKPRPNYLELLAWGQWEEPENLRMLHYYGRELMFMGFYDEAIERLEKYLSLPSAFKAEKELTVQYLERCRGSCAKA